MTSSHSLFPDEPAPVDAEVHFARMAHTSPHGIYVINLVTGRPLYVNPQVSHIFGRSGPELLTLERPLAMVVYGPDVAKVQAAHQRLFGLGDGEIVEYEYRAMHTDGSLRWVATRATVFARDATGRATQMLASAEDITRRREAEQVLAENQVRFERIAETMADAVYLFDVTSNRNIYFSSRIEAISGYTREQLAAMGDQLVTILLHPDDAPVFAQRRDAHRLLADGEVYETDFRARRPTGEIRWLHGRETVFSRDAEGFPKQILGTVKDATEARLREENLVAEARRKDEFLAMLAHELRNPLAPILSAAEVISLCDVHQFERLQRARQVIERQSRHMAKLVDDLLDVSRSVTGKVSLSLEWLDVDAAITRAIELSRPSIEARRQRVTIDANTDALRVYGDATRMAQVLGNLLNNASKYSPPESEITIEVSFADGSASIAIRDQGAGIAAEFLPHVFDLFSQSARSLDRSEGGLGIGLTLVKSLVELHGGSVTAQSLGVDQGSTFTVRLPAQRALIEAQRLTEAVRPKVQLRVLVVDDNVDSAEMLCLLLDTEGYVVNCCFDGPSALAEMTSGYDAIILDIGLPGMDGFAVARQVRKIHPAGKPILIALTGYGQPADFARSREAGFDYHLIKPVEPAALCRLLDSIATLGMQ